MAKDKNTFAKRQREVLKRQKAEAKQIRRRKRKEAPDIANAQPASGDVERTSPAQIATLDKP